MTTLEERLRDPDYRNWVKSALCLQYTRDGLENFSGLKSLELNQNIIQQLRLNGNPSVYNLCPTIGFDLRRKLITCCRNCNDILTEVMNYRPWRLDLNLKNADPTKLLHQHWQCSKMFMNTGQDVNSSGPKETDISALLNFVDHCTVPRGFVNNPDLLKQVRDTRNRVLHTSSMKITDNDFQNVITPLLIDLLSDPGFLQTDLDANEAVKKIRDVKQADFIITKDNEKEVLDNLTHEIRRMNELTNDEITKLTDQVESLNKDVHALKRNNQKEFEEMRDDVKKNDREVSKVRHMCEMLRTLSEQSTDIHDEMRQQLKDVQEQTKSTNEGHNALQLRVGDMERSLSDMQEQIEEGKRQRDDLAEEQTKLKDGQSEDRQDIQVLYKRQNNLSEEQTKLKDGQTEDRQDINVLNKRQDKLAEEQTKLREGQIEDKKDINVLNKRHDNLAEGQTKLKECQTEDRKDINVLYKRHDNLSEEQTQLKEGQIEDKKDINTLYEEQAKLKIDVDEVKGESKTCIPTEEDKSQLRQYLIDGYKDKLDVTLLPDWEPLHVSNIFTPAILICDRKKETQEKEKFRNLETYRELFYKNGVLQKRVVLLGEAGAGKTTFVKHVTDVWCETTMQPQFPDVDVLKKFKYLFYVSFRFAEEKETLSEMINSQLFGDETMKDVAKYVLKTYPEHCLIVLDGADEWKGSPTSETGRRGDIAGLPGLSGVDGCVILITSRPWRFHALSKKARDIFRRLEISGIKNVRELAYRILEQLADPYPVKSSYQFLRQAREKNMSELMKIPLLLIIALGGWVGDKSLHISITINYINMIQSFISRSKGQAGWSDPESKLRRLIPNLDKLETKWELESNKLPDVFLRYESIQRFAGLFLSLGELAFDLLLGKEEQSLVFSRQVLQKYPSVNYESVQVCLALGILSKTETLTCGIKKLESYAFCHKSFHEFFAALWLASTFSNQKSKLYKCIKTDRDLYSYEIMITFFCKLNPEAGKQLWLDLAQELEKEKELQNLVCKHMKKHRFDLENQSSIQVYFCVPHIVINWRTSDEDIMLLCHAMEKYPCNVKSLYVDARHSEQQASSMCRSTSSCCGLQSLKLKNLRTVSEHYLPSVNDLISPDLDLQKHNKLEILELHSLSIKGLLLPVEGARITSLTLYHVAMPHHSCEQLSESLSSCSYLVDLDLGAVRCREHRDSCCIPVLDLQKHDKLKRLELQVISIKGLLLPVEGARITSLMLYHVTMTHHSCKQLPEYLSSCSHLEDLYLNFVRCREHRYSSCIPVLDLQKHDKLETLRLLSLSIEGLLLPVEGARITSLKLKDVIMTHHGCKQLSGFFSSRPELWDPYLKVKCREHKDSPCQAIKDIRNLK